MRKRINAAERPDSLKGNPKAYSGSLNLDSLRRLGSPQHEGEVLKLHTPFFFSILPEFIQRILCSVSIFSFLAPRWEQRQLILVGSFLYKFLDERRGGASDEPKGEPIPVDSIDINLLSSEQDTLMGNLPLGYTTVFEVSTFRRKYRFACQSLDDALAWINSLRQARHEAITRSMGHAPDKSYPRSWEYFDTLGRNLLKRSERIRAQMEAKNLREMEMSNLGEGGPAPRGYHG